MTGDYEGETLNKLQELRDKYLIGRVPAAPICSEVGYRVKRLRCCRGIINTGDSHESQHHAMYQHKPMGRHLIQLCTNSHADGAEDSLTKRKICLVPGGTSLI